MDQERTLDEEGIPDLEGPLPEKVATGDPQEGVAPPSERPASFEYGITAAEQREGESIAMRVAREEPDFGDEDDDARTGYDREALGRTNAPDRAGRSAEEAAVHVDESKPL